MTTESEFFKPCYIFFSKIHHKILNFIAISPSFFFYTKSPESSSFQKHKIHMEGGQILRGERWKYKGKAENDSFFPKGTLISLIVLWVPVVGHFMGVISCCFRFD